MHKLFRWQPYTIANTDPFEYLSNSSAIFNKGKDCIRFQIYVTVFDINIVPKEDSFFFFKQKLVRVNCHR